MTDVPSPEDWAQLREQRPSFEEALTTREVTIDGHATGILLAIDHQADLHLLIPVTGPPATQEPADLNGLKVRHRVTPDGDYLGLLASAAHEHVFTPVCREVINAVHARHREPWAAVGNIIRQWQSAWRPSRQAMSKPAQVGLIGELLILLRVMVPALGPQAVFHWSGPRRERHDFIRGSIHLEVKTTRGSRHEHEISRLDQLWAPAGRRLLLASIQIEESVGGSETLADLIDELVQTFRVDSAASDDFLTKLVQVDWDDEMRRSGELLRFHFRDAVLYEVDETFPRLPDGFTPPAGVIGIRYTISLANLPPLDASDVIDAFSSELDDGMES
jgi:hypothetical protein